MTTKKEVNYNIWWDKYLATNTEEPGTKFRKNELLKIIKETNYKFPKILDSGCGAGELITYLINHKFPAKLISGSDVADKVIERNKNTIKKVNFFVYDLGINQKNKRPGFDIVICSEVIEHVRHWRRLISNLNKLTNIGGTIIISTQSGKRYEHHNELGHLKHFTTKEISAELEKNKLKIVKSYNCGWPFMNLKNILVNLPFLKARENIMRSQKQSMINKIIFKVFDVGYAFSSRSRGPQIFVVAKK
jgi:2-polyprenyl-3-methyl-5-hydroxy-6-metoxy-1,4-benzoquinol methylase